MKKMMGIVAGSGVEGIQAGASTGMGDGIADGFGGGIALGEKTGFCERESI